MYDSLIQIQFRAGSEPDSDTGSEPEKYDRRTQLDEHYQEKLGFNQEDDDEEEEKQVSFYLYSFYLSSIIQVENIHDMFINSECVPEERWFYIKWVRQSLKHLILSSFSSEGAVKY